MLVICLLGHTIFITPIQAQDPLNDPETWSKLLETPQDLSLWINYLDVSLGEVSDKDLFNVLKWSIMLVPGDETPTIGNPLVWHAASTMQEGLKGKMERHLFLKELEEEAQKDLPDLSGLTEDVEGNFLLMEDRLNQAFLQIGVKYVSWEETYPDNDYSKLGWIDDKKKELRKLKMLNIRLLKLRHSAN